MSRQRQVLHKMEKKGVSPIIAYVLLVGFAVALAAFFTTWYLKTSGATSQQQFEELEAQMLCEDAKINVGFTEDCKIKVFNTGTQVFEKVLISGSYKDAAGGSQSISEEIPGPINPTESASTTVLSAFSTATDIEVYANAQIKLEKKTAICVNERTYKPAITFTC